MRLTCGGCDTVWSGQSLAHCSACHRTFSTVNWFDAHRSPVGEHGACLDPASVLTHDGRPRMVLRGQVWGGPPLTQSARERLADIATTRAVKEGTA